MSMKPNRYAVPAALDKISEFAREGWFCGASAYGIDTIIIYYKDTKNCPCGSDRFRRYAGVNVRWKKVA